jgi:TonB-linked SusC/RagA family outer membrane protein
MKKTVLLALFAFMGIGVSYAQKAVTGVVTDASDGNPIPFASITVKGTAAVTSTGNDGSYSIVLPEGSNVLVFSFFGMESQEVSVDGRSIIDVALMPDIISLDEAVVTAMGLKRSEKSLGYAASTVKAEDLNAAKPVSVMSGITGKMAGVNISTSGATGSSQKVIIRGVSSFSANNPLYVVDGVPINDNYQGTSGLNQSTDFGSQSGDINPDDVESVTVLKGASATAIYGSRAANGVILITTKRGIKDEKVRVEYSGSLTVSNVLRTPLFQDMFGQGWPLYDPAENGSWGPKLDGMTREWGAPLNSEGKYDPVNGVYQKKPFSYVKDNIRDFYENGLEFSNNVSVSGGSKSTSFVMSYNNTTSDGVIPTNVDKFARNTFSFRGNTAYKIFEASYDVNYVRKDVSLVRGGQGSNGGATTFQELIQMPVDLSLVRDLRDFNNPYNNTDNYYTWYADNPYWVIANNFSKYQDDRVYGKVEVSLGLLDGLKATGRLGGDFANSRTQTQSAILEPTSGSWAYGHKTPDYGGYQEITNYFGQIDATVLLDADYKLGKDFRVTGVLGWNLNAITSNRLHSDLGSLNVPGWYSLENGPSLPVTTTLPRTKRTIGVFGQFDGSYREWAFVGVSLRNDWSSTLPKGKNSYFYWGVNGAIILTDAIPALKSNEILNFLKIRGGWGQTGNDAPLYRTLSYFEPTKIGLGFGSLHLPLNGAAGLTQWNTIPNQDLKPEITTEVEFGLDIRMLNNRLGLDFAWYNRNTKDQIINASLSPETGFTSYTRNIGKINNKGVEIRLYGTPLKLKNLTWELGATFTKNKSEVKELWGDTKEMTIASAYDVEFKAIVGEPIGVYQVPAIATVTDQSSPHYGKTIVNASGYPTILANEYKTVGSSAPDFTMGFNTRITFYGVTVGAVFDWRKGGVFYSNTARMLDWNGNGVNTLFNERQPFLVPNSVKVSGGQYVENDIPLMRTGGVLSYWNYSSANKGMEDNAVISRSNFKLRELSIGYGLPQKWFSKTPVSSMYVSVIGRNLFMFTGDDNYYVDPENTNYGNDIVSEFGEFCAGPSVRNIGGSIRITF